MADILQHIAASRRIRAARPIEHPVGVGARHREIIGTGNRDRDRGRRYVTIRIGDGVGEGLGEGFARFQSNDVGVGNVEFVAIAAIGSDSDRTIITGKCGTKRASGAAIGNRRHAQPAVIAGAVGNAVNAIGIDAANAGQHIAIGEYFAVARDIIAIGNRLWCIITDRKAAGYVHCRTGSVAIAICSDCGKGDEIAARKRHALVRPAVRRMAHGARLVEGDHPRRVNADAENLMRRRAPDDQTADEREGDSLAAERVDKAARSRGDA